MPKSASDRPTSQESTKERSTQQKAAGDRSTPRKSGSGRLVGGHRTNANVFPLVSATNEALDGGATGDGPADDDECISAAWAINALRDIAKGDERYGDGKAAPGLRAEADRIEEDASDRGCFFIDEPID